MGRRSSRECPHLMWTNCPGARKAVRTMSPASRVRLMAASLSIVLLMMPHFCSTFIMASHPLWKV